MGDALMDFAQQIALVTGGSRAIGRAVVQELAQRGATVLFCYRSNDLEAQRTLTHCIGLPGKVFARQADVSNQAEAEAFVAQALEHWARIHILVNCGGTVSYSPMRSVSTAQWRLVLKRNLAGVYHTSRASLRTMLHHRYGRIVNVAGTHGLSGFPSQTAMATAAAGVIGFTKALAREVAARSITVNAVAHGLIKTQSSDTMPPDLRAWGEQTIPLGRVGLPEEVAVAIAFLASPQASYITGHTLPVDGGWLMT